MPNPARAIYIDFECLKTQPRAPVLLGILRDLGDACHFDQVILDPTLASAACAAGHLRVGDPQVVGEALVAEAAASDCPLVGWSLFDRDVLLSCGLAEPLREVLRQRYVNALAGARPWKTIMHPQVRIGRASRFDAKNTLDRFAQLAGYGHGETLSAGTPARWIRRVQKAVKRAGRYRAVPARVKADWHSLLAYNQHDCRALRHVWLRATQELAAWRSYERTNYCFDPGDVTRICFTVGAINRRRDALLARAGASRWAFITAWNPASRRLDDGDNARRQLQLATMLRAAGYMCLPGEGIDKDGTWPAEASLFVMGISRRDARRVGRKFGQLAIVAGVAGRPAVLVRC